MVRAILFTDKEIVNHFFLKECQEMRFRWMDDRAICHAPSGMTLV